jgi:adenylate cyclase
MPPSPTRLARISQRFSWKTFALGFATTVLTVGFTVKYPSALLYLELRTMDLRMAARPQHPPSNKVLIVAIDDKSIAAIGQWPWSRRVMAQLEDSLARYRAGAVGYDIIFSERDAGDVEREQIAARLKSEGSSGQTVRSLLGTNNDDQFAAAIKAQGSTVLAYPFASHMFGSMSAGSEPGFVTALRQPPPLAYNLVLRQPGASHDLVRADSYLPPIEVLNAAARSTAFVDIDADYDGVLRRELTVVRFHDRLCVPLFMAVLSAYEHDASTRITISPVGIESVAIGDTRIPVDEMGRMMVPFRGRAGAFPHVSASDVIDHTVPGDQLAGKIALVGVTGHGLGDKSVTPAGGEFPRVEIHANAIDDVLTGDLVRSSRTTSVVLEREAAMALGIGVTIATSWLTALWAFLAALALAAGYFGIAQYVLVKDALLLNIVSPLLTVAVAYLVLATYRYVTEGLEKRRLRLAFEHYLHPQVIAAVVDNPGGLKLGGERRVLSILFADIVNYTSLSERTDPAALVALLNDYMTKMTDLILESGGVVDKIRGDGIMAFWGAPVAVPNHARASIDVALAMLAELQKLRRQDPRFAEVDIGIGIATGEAIAGNFGGARRFDYSVIGDTVNLASRLESLTRQFKVRLLVNKDTFTAAGGSYIARDIGLVRVKGKTIPVPVVEVVAAAGDGADPGYYKRFTEAIDLLQRGEAGAAREKFQTMLNDRPDDEVVGMYLEKLNDAGDNPPREMVFEFETK